MRGLGAREWLSHPNTYLVGHYRLIAIDLAVEVLRAYGIEPSRNEWVRPAPVLEGPALAAYVGFTRRRLCLPVEREPEIAAYVAEHPPRGRPSVVLWWDV